jgi:hypothetical protein
LESQASLISWPFSCHPALVMGHARQVQVGAFVSLLNSFFIDHFYLPGSKWDKTFSLASPLREMLGAKSV